MHNGDTEERATENMRGVDSARIIKYLGESKQVDGVDVRIKILP